MLTAYSQYWMCVLAISNFEKLSAFTFVSWSLCILYLGKSAMHELSNKSTQRRLQFVEQTRVVEHQVVETHNNKQYTTYIFQRALTSLMNEVEHDIKNYQTRSCRYQPKPKDEVNNGKLRA